MPLNGCRRVKKNMRKDLVMPDGHTQSLQVNSTETPLLTASILERKKKKFEGEGDGQMEWPR